MELLYRRVVAFGLFVLRCSVAEVAVVVTKMMTITLKSNGCGSNKMFFAASE